MVDAITSCLASADPLPRAVTQVAWVEELALGQSHYAVGRDRILVREIPGGSDAEPVAVLLTAK